MESEGREFVKTSRGDVIGTQVVSVRDRHIILRTQDNRAAKIVIGSWDRSLANLDSIKARARRIRNHAEWRYLRSKKHPGLLMVDDRVRDKKGDEGYLCEWLDAPYWQDAHPLASSLGTYLRGAIVLAHAAGELHRDGFIHGDITPTNVCLRGAVPVLVDYEMSIRIGQYLSDNPGRPGHMINATPACCSPEQICGLPIFPESDVFCIGLTLLSWVSGKFGVWDQGQTPCGATGLCERAMYPHWGIVRERLDERLVEILRKAISHRPRDRFANGHDLALALETALGDMTDDELARPLPT